MGSIFDLFSVELLRELPFVQHVERGFAARAASWETRHTHTSCIPQQPDNSFHLIELVAAWEQRNSKKELRSYASKRPNVDRVGVGETYNAHS